MLRRLKPLAWPIRIGSALFKTELEIKLVRHRIEKTGITLSLRGRPLNFSACYLLLVYVPRYMHTSLLCETLTYMLVVSKINKISIF